MKPLEKYQKMQAELYGLNYDEYAMAQYLHIAQVMNREEESYKSHRGYMLEWLKNIERTIYESARTAAQTKEQKNEIN